MKGLNIWLDALKVDATPDIDECIDAMKGLLPWLEQFKDTPQDPDWHAEGNVYIHTGMVLDECYQLLRTDAAHIQGEMRQALILAALLHDIAKPVCTKEVELKGVVRIASPKHETTGRSYLAYKLPHTNLSEVVIQTVLDLVGEHHLPKFLVIKNADMAAYFALARKVSLELLYFLEVADMRGRTCADREKQLGVMEEFKMFAKEYQLWQCQDPYQNLAKPLLAQLEGLSEAAANYVYHYALADFEQQKISMLEEAIGKTFAHRDHYANVVIMCGPSGSGKSSWIRQHLKDYDIVSLDALREKINGNRANQKNAGFVLQQAKELWRESLRAKRNVVWDATGLRKDFRTVIIDLAKDYHALVTLVVFRQSEKELIRKNAARVHPVSDSVLQKQLKSAQWPGIEEAHRYLVINGEGELVYQSPQLQKQPLCSSS